MICFYCYCIQGLQLKRHAENDNGTYIQKDHSEQQLLEKSLQEDHFVNLEGDCEADEAEVLLIKNNYKMFEDLE